MDIRNTIKKIIYKLSCGFTILPQYIAINITNICNRRCNFCPYHSPYLEKTEHDIWFRKQPRHINYNELKLFITRISGFKKWIKHISITGKGEPLLHPAFFSICSLINSLEIPFSITSNGDFIKENDLNKILNYEYLTGIRISIYDLDQWNKWKDIRHEKLSFFNQTGKYILGIEKGYTVQYKGTEQYATMPKDFNTIKSCKAPFSFLTINTDGSIVPCYSYNEIAHINDSLWKIWNGKKIRKYRRDALKMKTEHSDCKNCGIKIYEL